MKNIPVWTAILLSVFYAAAVSCTKQAEPEAEDVLKIFPESKTVDFNAHDITLKCTANYPVSAVSAAEWINVLAGDGCFVLSVDENPFDGTREGCVVFKTSKGAMKEFILTQYGVLTDFILFSPENVVDILPSGGFFEFSVFSNYEFSVSCNPEAGWAVMTSLGGGRYRVTCPEYEEVVPRSSFVEATSVKGAYARLEFTQKGAVDEIELSIGEKQSGPEGARFKVNVTANFEVNVDSMPEWVDTSRDGNVFSVRIHANKSAGKRSGEIVFKSVKGAKKVLSVTQEAAEQGTGGLTPDVDIIIVPIG